MSSDARSGLRPVERAVLRHVDAGLPNSDIAWRFRRTPRFVQQVQVLSDIPRQGDGSSSTTGGLRPVERCVLKARNSGIDYPEIAARLRRSPDYVARVEQFADFKLRTGRAEQ